MEDEIHIIIADDKSNESASRPLSMSMNGAFKDGGLASRIPRFSRRGSTNDVQSSRLSSSFNSSFELPLNKSLDSNMLPIQEIKVERGLKRYHSIYERGEHSERKEIISSSQKISTTSTTVARAKSPVSIKKGLNPTAVKRHKSFSAVESRMPLKRRSLLSPRSFEPPRSSSPPSPSSLNRRRGTIHTLDVARKEGIIHAKSATKTAAVEDPGRVQVFVRIRPPNETEDVLKHPLAVSVPDEESTQLQIHDGKSDKCYQFDGVVNDSTSNKEVFKTVGEPLVYSALSGFNGILMCYGQTGTGKTYTLMSNDGMSVRIVYQCFKVINADKNHKYTVTCSYLQIYQEKLYDLLNETRTIDLSLREHPKTGVYIENLTEYVVHSPKDVLNLLKVGKRRLVFAETKMNRASSRSHAICQLKFLKERVSPETSHTPCSPSPFGMKTPDFSEDEDYDDNTDQLAQSMDSSYQSLIDDDEDEDVLKNVTQLEDGVTSVHGKIYICDLAGSERIKKTKASGERLQEAQHINSSLLELGNVIQALAEGNRSHVPFRNSTLTRLLQEGLSGNCKTRLVVCIAPTVRDIHETKCSLNFGSRAMKVQVMAHVNYEVDYKKLAEALAAKLETLENDWNIKKKNYEKFIAQLKSEVGARRTPTETVPGKSTPRQIQSLLLVELMTLQLFHNVQVNSLKTPSIDDALQFSSSHRDMMLQSMEGLLELLSDYMRDSRSLRSKNISNLSNSENSSAITSPDCIEQNSSATMDVPSTLEPVARFLEHAQITSANSQQAAIGRKLEVSFGKRIEERLHRVVDSLLQLKETVSSRAIKHLKDTFENALRDCDKSISSLNSLDDIVATLDEQKDLLSHFESLDDVVALEQSLYYLQMDKAFLSCLILLNTQTKDCCGVWNNAKLANSHPSTDMKRLLEELTSERSARDKLQDELYTVKEEQVIAEEKLKDIELELKTVRELKDSLESKLHFVEDRNSLCEEQLESLKKEKEKFEGRIMEIEKQKLQLETSLKSSDNNNARKERLIVDLKNEKVALDSLVTTLKEEISILEKERSQDVEERRRIEEELEDFRDRNIILETEWSCCREENGLLENELTALEEDKAILEDELLKYRDDVKMLEEAVSMLEAQGADYKQDIVGLKVKEERLLASIRTEKDKFNKELNSLRQEMSTLRVERRRFQRDISVSKADKSNTERAYNALKVQKDALQEDMTSYKQEEKRLQREISLLKSDRTKLERDVMSLRNENAKLKQELLQADKLKVDLKLLQKNEEKIAQIFNTEKTKLYDHLVAFKDKFTRMEQDFSKITIEKDKLAKQLKRFEQISHADLGNMRRSQSQPNANASSSKPTTPDKTKAKPSLSVQGALVRRSVHSGEVSEVEGRVLDLQRRLAFFMAEKEDIQKELITTRERNAKLTSEIKFLEEDTSKIQCLLTTLSSEKESLLNKLTKASESKAILEKEKDELKDAVEHAQNTSTKLQTQLEEVAEKNRLLEIDHVTVKDSVKALQNETIVLATENKHIKSEFEKVDEELRATRSIVQTLNKKLSDFKEKVKVASEKENTLQEQVSLLETENMSLTDQLGACHQEEKVLLQQLLLLNQKFHVLESTMFESILQNDAAEYSDQITALKEINAELGSTVSDLKMQLETLALDAKNLKVEREEIELLMKEMMEDSVENMATDVSLLDNIRHLKKQVLKIKQEKAEVEDKFNLLETQMKSINRKNEALCYQETSRRLQQEKLNYKQHIDDLQQQIEDLVKERIQLEAELEYLKNQNAELRKEIAIILVDNTNLERELETLESEFVRQEDELQASTEETKALLRQLCTSETQNLSLCTMQSIQQDDLEMVRKQVEELQKEKERFGEETLASEMQKKTLRDRLLMAELEISQLKSEHANVENQRRMLIEDLDAADRERSLLKSELHGLARALSPLKKEVTEVIRKQESMQNDMEQEDGSSGGKNIYTELIKIKEDMSSFNAEKAALELEQFDLEKRLKSLGEEKKDLRKTLRHLIQELDAQSRESSDHPVAEMEESINLISDLIKKKEDLSLEKDIFTDDLLDAQYKNHVISTRVNTATEELKSTQEDLCLRTVERLKIKDKIRRIDRSVTEIQNGDFSRTGGIVSLSCEVTKLKGDLEKFETAQLDLLSEVRGLSEEIDTAKTSLTTVVHFKNIIERNLHLCKERNNRLESHLRVIYDDLINIESRMDTKPSVSAKVLLETLDLHKHFQSLEDDLRNTESQNLTLKEDAADLRERCAVLEEEKQLNTVSSGYLQDSVDGQDNFITQLQREKDSLVYEKSRLETKLSLYKDDKKRLLEDFQRVTKSLGAYARYNKMLEKKLQSLKIDLSELENSSDVINTRRASLMKYHTGQNSDLLCERCSENLDRKFKGVHENTQLLGEELLDCIDDNLSLETAIFTFLEQKAHLEQQVVALETEQRDFQRVNLNERSNSFRWSGSDSFDFDFLKRVWTSGQLSTRSKSMTLLSGESYPDGYAAIPPTTRAHTALGICGGPLLHQSDSPFDSSSSVEGPSDASYSSAEERHFSDTSRRSSECHWSFDDYFKADLDKNNNVRSTAAGRHWYGFLRNFRSSKILRKHWKNDKK